MASVEDFKEAKRLFRSGEVTTSHYDLAVEAAAGDQSEDMLRYIVKTEPDLVRYLSLSKTLSESSLRVLVKEDSSFVLDLLAKKNLPEDLYWELYKKGDVYTHVALLMNKRIPVELLLVIGESADPEVVKLSRSHKKWPKELKGHLAQPEDLGA